MYYSRILKNGLFYSMETESALPRVVLKSAMSFLSGTLLSRVGGLVRDVSMAYCFGVNPSIAAFLVAYRFSNLMRRIFGEGVLLNGFVPQFETHRQRDPKEAARFFRDLAYSLSIVLVLFIFAVEVIIGYWILPGLSQDNQLIAVLTMLMLPGLFFVSLFGLCGALLQCEKKYFLSGAAPLAFNLVWIGAIWLFYGKDSYAAVVGLSLAIVLAFFCQWLITVPDAIRFFLQELSWRDLFAVRFFPSEVRQMLSAVTFGMLGVSATQINNALDFVFARMASLEGPAYLNYAIHLYQLPLALFGIAMTSALLPPLSRVVQKGDWVQYRSLLHYSISKTCLLLLLSCAGIFALGGTAVSLIYSHGKFDHQAAVSTTWCLWGYGIGLVPAGLAMLLASAFYSQKDFMTPAIATLTTVALNTGLNALFVCGLGWGAVSVAIATSVASLWNALFLLARLSKHHPNSSLNED